MISAGWEATKNFFSGIFSRESQEILEQSALSGGVGSGFKLLSQTIEEDEDGNVIKVIEHYGNGKGDTATLIGDGQANSISLQGSIAGQAFSETYEGVGRNETGPSLTINQALITKSVGNGGSLEQNYTNGNLNKFAYYFNGQEVLDVAAANANGWKTADDWWEQSDVRINLPDPIIVEAPEVQQPSPAPFSISWNILGGIAQAAEFTVNQGALSSSSGTTVSSDPDRELYVLANGIGNTESNDTLPPDYIQHLEEDLKNQSQGQPSAITQGDLFAIPLYQPNLPVLKAGDNALNKGIDVLKWVLESQLIPMMTSLTVKVISSLLNLKTALARPIVAMGYSGGFVPLVEGALRSGAKVKSFVSLAGMISNLGAVGTEIVNLMVQAADKIQQGVTDGLEILLDQLFHKIPIVGKAVDWVTSIINSVKTKTLDQSFALFQKALTKLGQKFTPALPAILPISTDLLVNLWGTKDILHQLNLVGERSEVSGFTLAGQRDPVTNEKTKQLFNIEIEGATHFDYMRRGDTPANACTVLPGTEACWNANVSEFVTRLLIASKTPDDLAQFLNSQPVGVVSPPDSSHSFYIISLPGHP